jgi:hypothetical protein
VTRYKHVYVFTLGGFGNYAKISEDFNSYILTALEEFSINIRFKYYFTFPVTFDG